MVDQPRLRRGLVFAGVWPLDSGESPGNAQTLREAGLGKGNGVLRISVVFVVAFLIPALVAGCGQDSSGEESGDGSGEQYEGGEPTAPAQAGTGFSEEACLEKAAELGDAGVEISDPGEVPSYEVSGESEMEPGKELEVVTEATSREELQTVAEDLRFENQGQEALSIDFYNEGPEGERQDAGLALVFNTREAACRAFQYPVEEQDELVSESNGMSVVSVEEGV